MLPNSHRFKQTKNTFHLPEGQGIASVSDCERVVSFLVISFWAPCILAAGLVLITSFTGWSAEEGMDSPPPVPTVTSCPQDPSKSTNAASAEKLYIKEFRVLGSHQLSRAEIEKAVYPYMGPERTPDDVEKARTALEKAFQDKGFQTVNVQIPQQTGKRGIVFLQVTEAKIGRLNVEGSRFFSVGGIKKKVPSLAPGTVPDFNKVSSEILALNQWSDRQVIPTLTPGFEPGTVDVNLNVKDTLPWHGSAEVNNRYSPNTVPYRVNLASSYDDLWQRGDAIGGSFQIAPQNDSQALNWNVFYTARIPSVDWLRVNVSYGEQNSDVSTLGGGAVNGAGNTAAFRFLCALPGEKDFSQSFNWGIDFKHLSQVINPYATTSSSAAASQSSPLDYWPIRLNYNAVWAPKGAVTIFNAGLSFGIRGAIVGSYGNEQEFANLRYNSDSGFSVLKGDLSHTHDLPGGFQIFGKVQGQVSPNPLVYSEQIAGGGLDTCRGYLEGTQAGDNGVFASTEFRSPSLIPSHVGADEWRVYGFFDCGALGLNEPLPGQTANFNFASYGGGSRMRVAKDLNASIDVGVPLVTQAPVMAWSPLITFRLFGDF